MRNRIPLLLAAWHFEVQRIIDGAAKKLKVPAEKVVSNIEKYGNTSAGSVPIAIAEAVEEGRIKEGDVVATAGFGAGLTWASAILRVEETGERE